ncbi:hypothetical protein V7S43_017209 [Phytophthora oleae]|uniref:Peptidase A2 domain-containing protein n=1 Tax=Phytophthora oleae TaxID=2107226 RepID=A0ABD3EV29_9STRA
MPFCVDSGAEVCAIGSEHVQRLMKFDPPVEITGVDKGLTATTFGGQELTAIGQVQLNVKLNTAAGPVNLVKTIKCLVVDE